jgi:Ca2+-binding RTX toxin-like protein
VILTGAGWDVVDAGDGDDIVRTGTGDDIVAGGRGNDKISTGDGFDLIFFNEGDGRDQVIDFDLEFDLIGLAVDGISGFGDLDGLIEAQGNGRTVIDFGDGDAIVLLGVDADALTEDHFVFA